MLSYLLKIGPFYSRLSFERRNYQDEGARPFSLFGKSAHCLFHFSSEGEFEQIKPLADEMISLGKNIELIFTSPSVEHKVLSYYQAHRENIRYLRLPLLSYFPLLKRQNIIAWSSAKKMMMVRYDFFPELVYLGTKMHEFILFSATAKSSKAKFDTQGEIVLSGPKKFIYSQFSEIIAATDTDMKLFKDALPKANITAPIELRMIQINNRQKSFRKHRYYDQLNQLLSLYEYENRICLAQVWKNEIDIFHAVNLINDIEENRKFIFLAPHLLSEENIEAIKVEISKRAPSATIHQLEDGDLSKDRFSEKIKALSMKPGIVLCTVKGVLCEIYPYFSHVFVGGGHGKGVHSLLEPFVAGAQIYCGPNVHRSTEYDLIINSNFNVSIIDDCRDLYAKVIEKQDRKMETSVISAMIEDSELAKRKLIKLLTK